MKKRLTYRTTARKTLMAFEGQGSKSMRLSELSETVHRHKSSVCRALKKLVAAGHVTRVRMDHSLHFVRTAEGEKLCACWLNKTWKPDPTSPVVTPADVIRN